MLKEGTMDLQRGIDFSELEDDLWLAPQTWDRDDYMRCFVSPLYFIHQFCMIEDKVLKMWISFRLWDWQFECLDIIHSKVQVIILKARQLGLTWLLVCYALWMMIFRKETGILLFSRRDDEAGELLERIRGMYERLRSFLQPSVTVDNAQEYQSGLIDSWVRLFPTTKHSGGMDTATMVIIDEVDFLQ
jgi:hypothetical protein